MTYIEFRDKYNGRYLDYDGGYPPGNPYQCWDLAQYYFTEVLGVPDTVLSGCGLVSNMLYPPKRYELDEYFDEVDAHNMCQGDVAIWERGHIAILDHYDGANWWFSQNPGCCMVKTIDNLGAYHVFRRKQPAPPTPVPTEVTPNVERNPYQNQLEVIADGLRVRNQPSVNGAIVGIASKGEGDKKYYNYYEKYTNLEDEFDWYKIADYQWIAHRVDWVVLYPAQEPTEPPTIPPTPEDYVKLKVLDRKDGSVLVNCNIWIKE